MKWILFLASLCLFTAVSKLQAGELIVAVLQFPTLVEEQDLRESLAGESLAGITETDRIDSKNRLLRGTPVIFSQRVQVSAGSTFSNVTRIGTSHAEVSGKLDNGISVNIAIAEGVQGPLRRFSRSVYRGSGKLSRGNASLLSLRQVDTKQPTVVKGKSKIVTNQYTMALIYQFNP